MLTYEQGKADIECDSCGAKVSDVTGEPLETVEAIQLVATAFDFQKVNETAYSCQLCRLSGATR